MKNKVVIITGASSGIGEATAKLLASQGAKIVLAARREERLQALQNEIKKKGGEAVYQITDVTSREQMDSLAKFALNTYGKIDAIINNAGLMPQSPLNELKVDEWERMIDVNIKGVLYGIAAVLPVMRAQKSGHIITLSSVAGHFVHPAGAIYSATKYAVRILMEGLRQEEALDGTHIRCTTISPGAVATELLNTITTKGIKDSFEAFYQQLAIKPEAIASSIAFAIEQPDDVALNEIIIRPTMQQ